MEDRFTIKLDKERIEFEETLKAISRKLNSLRIMKRNRNIFKNV